nr:glucose/ribitol dehydrogenase [Tanacetum cinerariifolium]
MAIELGMYKIRVNSINPRLSKSEITEGLIKKDWLKNAALRTTPLKTFSTVDPALTVIARFSELPSAIRTSMVLTYKKATHSRGRPLRSMAPPQIYIPVSPSKDDDEPTPITVCPIVH